MKKQSGTLCLQPGLTELRFKDRGRLGDLREEIFHIGRERGFEGERGTFEFERESRGMEGLAREQKFGFQSWAPIRFDELEVTIFVRAVDFITDNWVAEICEVHANLVGSAGFWFGLYEGEWLFLVLEPLQDSERSKGWIAVGMDCLF